MKLFTSIDVIRKLRAYERFAFVKINHGLWERLTKMEKLQSAGITDPDQLERETKQRPSEADGGFLDDLRRCLARMPELGENFFFSATPYAWPSSRRIEGTPKVPRDEVVALIDRWVPAGVRHADGLVWKTSVYDGSFAAVIDALRGRTVVVVGPYWIRNFGVFAGFPNFVFHEIHASRARDERWDIYGALHEICRRLRDPVVILSAGHMSPLIVTELLDKLPDATFLDMGGVVDICHVPTIACRNWAVVRRADVSGTIEAIHPSWARDARAYTEGMPPRERQAIWLKFSQGTDPSVYRTIGLQPRRSNPSHLDRPDLQAGKIPFIERKTPDWSRIADICTLSQRLDHWANFGPVVTCLAAVLHAQMELPEDRVVIPASSATTALHAVVGAHAVRAGRPLVWAISAFGFPSTAIGPLADHLRIVDCDDAGFLDLDQLAALEPGSWDGVILTNIFGNVADLARYSEFCFERGKPLVIDSALGFEGPRAYAASADEVVSFHHTKPWGFGEGGCAIVSRETAELTRNFLNFGFAIDGAFARFATNGKLSDLAAAAILERLERRPSWSTFYRMQYVRVLTLALQAGTSVLGHPVPRTLKGHIPVLAKGPIDLQSKPASRFDVRKYYRPLAGGFPVAEDIYGRILNVPCHPGMAAVPTAELQAFFSAVAEAPI